MTSTFLMNENQFICLAEQTAFDADGCLLWTGTTYSDGYGMYLQKRVHILFYLYMNGFDSNPEGLELAHKCHKKLCLICVRPKTRAENAQESFTRYKWDRWFDGATHQVQRGKDFDVSMKDFQFYVHRVARKRGLKVRTRINGNLMTIQIKV